MSAIRPLFAAALLGLASGFTMTAANAAPGTAAGGHPARAAWLAGKVAADPALAAIADLLALERLYRSQQKPDAVRSLYQGALAQSSDPVIQNFAQRRLARLEWRQGNADAAEQLLKDNLERNLGRSGGR